MKAILEGKEIEMENPDGSWVPKGAGTYSISSLSGGEKFMVLNGETFTATLLEVNREEKLVTLLVNGKKTEVKIKEPMDDLLHSMGLDKLTSHKAASIKAPMPGLVLEVSVQPGDQVKKGDKVLVLEAMKMENIIKAAGDGVVSNVMVSKGHTVDKNQTLIEFS